MDDERARREIKRAKRFNYICFGIVITGILAVCLGMLIRQNRPVGGRITISGLERAMQMEEVAVTEIGQKAAVVPTEQLAELLCLDQWAETEWFSQKALVKLCFSEGYVLSLYEGDLASAFDEYAESGTRNTAFYQMPQGVLEQVMDYLNSIA